MSKDTTITTLPPVHAQPVLLLRFTSKASLSLIDSVKARLNEEGIIIFEEKDSKNGTNTLFGLTVSQDQLEREAERCALQKPCALIGMTDALEIFEGTTVLRPFEVAHKNLFTKSVQVDMDHGSEESTVIFCSAGLFTSAERIKILFSELESLPVLKPGSSTSNLARILNESIQVPTEEIATKFRDLYLFDTLVLHEFVDVFAPAHNWSVGRKIAKAAFDFFAPFPIESIRSYYGEEIAFYFAWLQFYTKFLLFPGLSGLFIYLARIFYFGDTVDTCRLTPFHGIITFFWALAFIQFWAREENKLAHNWGMSTLEGVLDSEIRHDFKGELRKSQVTGQMEKYYPANIRRLKYAVSAVITMALLILAFSAMILSLNAQGFIKHQHKHHGHEEDCDHPFHIPWFASLAEEGAIFDSKSTFCSYIPVILHVALVLTMNTLYRRLAKILTEWENHKFEVDFNNSMIVKRFCFEAIDCYFVLLFLAFYEQDVIKVRSELVSVFHVDTFRRILLEGLIPYIMQQISDKRGKDETASFKKSDGDEGTHSPLNDEATKEEYEQFDDYIEMIIQLGYITLFASAYPLAPFVALIANLVEMRLDMFKITFITMRPRCIPTSNIGMWKTLIRVIVWGSAITNCLIFTFSSMQMVQWLPEYFTVDSEGEHNLKAGSGWVVVFIVFGIERLLLVLGIFLNLAIPDVPEEVLIKDRRKRHIDFRIQQDLRGNKNEKSFNNNAMGTSEKSMHKGNF